ncbi:hypothetical protein M1B34_11475 [Pseudomonas sp. MAFF 302030]|jgi:hypothetical protein|uniref:DUF6602 domain-containing protein n=1 Tax=Pseudomonas morbosilactucae TaxID=2938197 RepID=A0A9X1YUA2_9PSED|nr:DUF6602 domain-containing protein [Pseudomonas morbosilactucae]MCK9798328.1 hypothetical protein [Pseudomonas morbosilactucae]
MTIISRWAKSIARVLDSSFNVSTSIADHPTLLGDARESFIRDVLKRFLPSNISIGSGQVIDACGGISKQIDLIIYRNDFPTLRTFGSADVYLIEGVIATVEVKSQLNNQSLALALENGKSVRNLKPSVLGMSLNAYCEQIYQRPFDQLNTTQINSIMGLILPPTYIYAYRGYTQAGLDTLRGRLNDWYNTPNENGEQDITLMPEVICTEGCVTLKNLNNLLQLPAASGADLEACYRAFNSSQKSKRSKADFLDCFRSSSSQEFHYGIGMKTSDTPLQYLISSLLEAVISRIGYQQLGGTGIQYNLQKYHISADMEGNWSGAAVNLTQVSDPKLEFAKAHGL